MEIENVVNIKVARYVVKFIEFSLLQLRYILRMDLMESFTNNANSEQSNRSTYTTINHFVRNKLDPLA